MVLLVTTLLSLVTMFDTVRNNSPDALELKCIEVRTFQAFMVNFKLVVLGLAAVLHVLCVSGADGVLHCAFRNPV